MAGAGLVLLIVGMRGQREGGMDGWREVVSTL